MLSNIDLCLPSFTTFNQHRHFHSEKEKISQLINIICILFRDQRTKFVDRDLSIDLDLSIDIASPSRDRQGSSAGYFANFQVNNRELINRPFEISFGNNLRWSPLQRVSRLQFNEICSDY